MISDETLMNDLYKKIILTVHTYASDKHLSAIISQNNKPIALL